jgi:hypothetical protein
MTAPTVQRMPKTEFLCKAGIYNAADFAPPSRRGGRADQSNGTLP